MSRSLLVRLLAYVVAMFGSLAAPASALAHGIVHAHLAHEHEEDGHHGAGGDVVAGLEVGAHSGDDHAHAHAKLDAVPGSRHAGRFDVSTVDVLDTSEPVLFVDCTVLVHAPARVDLALLARPDPRAGPPPRPRAPPID